MAEVRPLQTLSSDVINTCRTQVPRAYEALVQCDGLLLNADARLEAKEAELTRCIEVGQEVLLQLNTMKSTCADLTDENESLRMQLRQVEQQLANARANVRNKDVELDGLRRSRSHSASPGPQQPDVPAIAPSSAGDAMKVQSLRTEIDRAVERILDLERLLEGESSKCHGLERQWRMEIERGDQLQSDVDGKNNELASLRQQLAEVAAERAQESIDVGACGVIVADMLQSATRPDTLRAMRMALQRLHHEQQKQVNEAARAEADLRGARQHVESLEKQIAVQQQSRNKSPDRAGSPSRRSMPAYEQAMETKMLESQLEAAQATIENQKQQIASMKQQREDSANKATKARADAVEAAEASLMDARHRITMLEATNQELRDQLNEVAPPQVSAAQFESRVANATAEATAATSRATQAEEQSKELLGVVEAQRTELSKLQGLVDTLTARLQSSEADLVATKSSADTMSRKLDAQEREVSARSEDAQAAVDAIKEQLDVSNLDVSNPSLTAENESLQQLVRRADQAGEEVPVLRQQVSTLSTKLTASESERSRLSQELADSASKLEYISSTHTVPDAQHKLVVAELESVQERLATAQAELRRECDTRAAVEQDTTSKVKVSAANAAQLEEAAVAAARQLNAVSAACQKTKCTSALRLLSNLVGTIRAPIAAALRTIHYAGSEETGDVEGGDDPYVNELIGRLVALESDVEEAAKEVRSAQQNAAAARNEVFEKEKEVVSLRSSVGELTAELDAKKSAVGAAQKEVTELRQSVQDRDKELYSASLELGSFNAATTRAKKTAEEANGEVARLEAELKATRQTIVEMRQTAKAAVGDRQGAAADELAYVQDAHAALQGEARNLRDAVEGLEADLHDARLQLQANERTCESLRADNAQLSGQLNLAKREILKFQRDLAELSVEDDQALRSRDEELIAADNTITNLRRRNSELEAQTSRTASVSSASGTHGVATAAASREVQRLHAQVLDLRRQLGEFESVQLAAEGDREKAVRLETENNQLRDQMRVDDENADALREQIATLEGRLASVERDRDSLRRRLDER